MADNDTSTATTEQAPVETSPTPDSIPSAGPLSGSAPSDSSSNPDTPATGYMTLTGAPVNPGPNQTPADAIASQASQSPAPKSIWLQVALGALAGLTGAGGKTFSEGVGRGAQAELAQKQLQTENAQKAQQIQFESVRAADSHIAALDEHNRADQLSDEAKLDYKTKQAGYQNFLQDNFGVTPDLSFNDSGTEATAGMQTLANANGGTIPPVVTSQKPEADGTHGNIAVYSPSQQQFQQNSNGYRKLVDTQRAAQGLPAMNDATWNSLGFKGQRDASLAAVSFMSPTPAFSLDKNTPTYLPVVLAQKQQQLTQYQNHKDINGKPDADPEVVSQLQNGVDYLQKSWDSSNKMENDAASAAVTAQAPAKAASAAMVADAEAKAKLPYELAKTKADQAVKDGDPNAAGQLLFNGDVAPSQITSGRNGEFATKAFAAAKALAKAQGKTWDAQTAEGYFKTASAPANVTFYGSANSLLDKGGTIDQTRAAYDALPTGQIPAINGVVNWADKTIGGKAPSGFAATALGLADDYSKVMTGGQGSDSSRNEILKTLISSSSPAQMQQTLSNMRAAVQSQVGGRIGTNPVAKKMYGYNLPESPQTGEHAVQDKTGRTIGYTTDGKTMRPL